MAARTPLRVVLVKPSKYGRDGYLEPPPLVPPSRRDLRRYAVRLMGIYPARGCPFTQLNRRAKLRVAS